MDNRNDAAYIICHLLDTVLSILEPHKKIKKIKKIPVSMWFLLR